MTALLDLQTFLSIKTVSRLGVSLGSYRVAAEFLVQLLLSAGLSDVRSVEYVPGKPVVIARRPGLRPELPCILLSGHYDVVPVDEDKWTVDPFGGIVLKGRIYGRGAQDMKSVLIQYIHAVKLLKNEKLDRSIVLTFFPDEEVGGTDGVLKFIESSDFTKLDIALVLDEGLANPGKSFSLFYGERAINYVRIKANGPTGHGSRFVKDSAVENLVRILGKIYKYRSDQEQRMLCNCNKLGDVLTVNVTGLHAGSGAHNVVPSSAELTMDVRVPLSENDLPGLIDREFIKEDGENVEVEFIAKTEHPIQVESSKAWLERVSMLLGDVEPQVFPAATDSRYFRKLGIPCIGFSPIIETPILLHDNDEFIYCSNFEHGIDVYLKLIRGLCTE